MRYVFNFIHLCLGVQLSYKYLYLPWESRGNWEEGWKAQSLLETLRSENDFRQVLFFFTLDAFLPTVCSHSNPPQQLGYWEKDLVWGTSDDPVEGLPATKMLLE